jgi:hypothetical protein
MYRQVETVSRNFLDTLYAHLRSKNVYIKVTTQGVA